MSRFHFANLTDLQRHLAKGDARIENDTQPAHRATRAATAQRSEHEEQVDLIQRVKSHEHRFPCLALLFAIPNGGARSKATAGKLKAEGVRVGIPDLCLPVARISRSGVRQNALYLELKVGYNKPTQAQLDMHRALRLEGNRVVVCWGADEAEQAIIEYLENNF